MDIEDSEVSPSAPQTPDYQPGAAISRSRRPSNIEPAPSEESKFTPGAAIPRVRDARSVLQEAASPQDPYTEFCDSHPYISAVNIPVTSMEASHHKTPNTSDAFELESRLFAQAPVALVTAIDKGEDAVGVTIGPDGKVVIVIADGVSTGLFPKVASRVAVGAAMNAGAANGVDRTVFKSAHDAILQTGLEEYIPPLLAGIEARLQRARADQNVTEIANRSQWRRAVHKRLESNAYGSTTLGALSYDRESGSVDYALKSDTSIIVMRADGSHELVQNGKTSTQIHYMPLSFPDREYHPDDESEKDGKLTLGSGDVVIMCSDGLDTGMNDVIKGVHDAREIGTVVDQSTVAAIVKGVLVTRGVGDDVSVAIVAH